MNDDVIHKNYEIELLLKDGILGFYNMVEITEIFAIMPDGKRLNILTIMVAEFHKKPIHDSKEYITLKPFSVIDMKRWKFGILKYYQSADELLNRISQLTEEMFWDKDIIKSEKLVYKNKKFVAPDSFEYVPINNVLKNNFHNGSYILEWFDESKKYFNGLFSSHNALKDLSSKIQEYVPIAISAVSDRIGNFILQIPSRILQSKFTLTKKDDNYNLICNIYWHPDAVKRDLIVNCMLSEEDKIIEGYHTQILTKTQTSVIFPFSYERPHIGTIWDTENNLILATTRPSAFISPRSKIVTSTSYYAERVIKKSNGVIQKNAVNIPHTRPPKNNYNKVSINWTVKRKYDEDREKLKSRRDFIQYNPRGQNKKTSHEDALKDLRYLINEYGKNEVWLWDPYLSPDDIFDTLFHNTYSMSEMRAITALYTPPTIKNNLCIKCSSLLCSACADILSDTTINHNIINDYRNSFIIPSGDENKINFEFRCKTGNNGWNFHDRFLIFPNNNVNDKPRVWSLGTSVNSFGKEHHILQQVSDAQLIVDAFLELWNALSNQNCIIWVNHAQ